MIEKLKTKNPQSPYDGCISRDALRKIFLPSSEPEGREAKTSIDPKQSEKPKQKETVRTER